MNGYISGRRSVAALLLGLVIVPACGGDDEEPDPLRTREGFCAEWGEAACTKEVVSACAATDAEACAAAQAAHCMAVVSAGAYERSLARACLDSVRDAYADEKLTAAEAAVVLRGGAPCDFVCVEVDGECVPPEVVGGGQECSDAATICEEGFYCDGSNCLAVRTEGRACSDTIPCAEGLKCVEGTSGMVCEAKAGPGQPCATGEDCVSGICTLPAGDDEGICANEIILSAAEPTCSDLR